MNPYILTAGGGVGVAKGSVAGFAGGNQIIFPKMNFVRCFLPRNHPV